MSQSSKLISLIWLMCSVVCLVWSYTLTTLYCTLIGTSLYCRVWERLKKLWYFCPVFMILTPAHQRPRAKKMEYSRLIVTEEPMNFQLGEFRRQLWESFSCLFSRSVWNNAPFLFYVLTNGMAAAGVVIPWTFVYDYVRTEWLSGLDSTTGLNAVVETQLAWYPSLIGLGSCAGRLVTSRV